MTRKRPTTIRCAELARGTGIDMRVLAAYACETNMKRGRHRINKAGKGLYIIDEDMLSLLENYKPRTKDAVDHKHIRNFIGYHRPYLQAQKAVEAAQKTLDLSGIEQVLFSLIERVGDIERILDETADVLHEFNEAMRDADNRIDASGDGMTKEPELVLSDRDTMESVDDGWFSRLVGRFR